MIYNIPAGVQFYIVILNERLKVFLFKKLMFVKSKVLLLSSVMVCKIIS